MKTNSRITKLKVGKAISKGLVNHYMRTPHKKSPTFAENLKIMRLNHFLED